jgi:hypothetical protein
MSLVPRPPKQEHKRFITFDLEWWPKTMKFRICGVYDKKRGYRHYSSMSSFLDNELTPENYGVTFFAHNGGKSDMHFVFDELSRSGLAQYRFDVEAAFNGASAFLVTLAEKDAPKQKFTFADTLFLLKSSLKKIGELLGYEKGEFDFESDNFAEMRAYNQRDCEVLYKAVEQLEAELFAMGGEFKTTLASSAMALFTTRYLKQVLPTDRATNLYARKSYYASRVEVFTRECQKAKYVDVNSSFPWSMKQVLPGRFIKTTRTLREKPLKARCYMADATVRVRECYLPPLPFRDADERILFPTGTWRAPFTDVDLKLCEEQGHEIVTIHSVDWFEGFTALSDYVDDIYEKKANAKGFKRELYKLLLNALYGKFAEGDIKKKMLFYPRKIECPHKVKHAGDSCMEMISPGVYAREDFKPLQHVHVPISAAVTAHSRALLYSYMSRVPFDEGGRLFYVDTDSVVYSDPLGREVEMPMGDEVGMLKLEYEIDGGIFAAPKLYMLETPGKIVVRSKGFSALDGTSFKQLCRGEFVTVRRMQSIKENVRSGNMTPKEVYVPKQARFLKTKRADLPGGETRPWTVEEIAFQQ